MNVEEFPSNIYDYPDDIQEAVDKALVENDIYGCGDDGNPVAYEYLARVAIAYAIKKERHRCGAIAFKAYEQTPSRKSAGKALFDIVEGNQP
ncbi:hypothetical protein F9K88_08180 [Brucella intermedia]|uniref:hypothetical protein n=1 Tax=Brucella intermedia TaxID=94625 RepID=UPI00124EA728|nr:hypothetical protein [Brucella intermedia]KAB2712922.1 hypothetical protein F9K88_08180 [Brucella intermedia]